MKIKSKGYLKVIGILYIIALHFLILHLYCNQITVPSFHYNFYYKNESSHDYVLIKGIQLTDVPFGPTVLPNSSIIVPKEQTGHLQIPGEVDFPNTLFVVVAVPCTEKGRLIESESKNALIEIIPFSSIRNNSFSDDSTFPIIPKTDSITDDRFIPIDDIIGRFEITEESH
ncbi:MAG: hypothetical protein GX130_13865 [Candidatus Hydrogenedens sp.]|jgi:hypothetical protein|nr:hypothetical protein [Candidatus Hydrogenedens sp.]